MLLAVSILVVCLIQSHEMSIACDYGPETCVCDYFPWASTHDLKELMITCESKTAQNYFSLFLSQLNSSYCYWVSFNNKYIPIVNDLSQTDPICLLYLDLSHNQIGSVEREVFDFARNMEGLYLMSNELISLSFLDSSWTSSLKLVNAQDNLISLVNSSWFTRLGSLTELVLSDNLIKIIYKNSLAGLFNLKVISLGGNNIKKIEAYAFGNQSRVATLKITSQKIEQLDSFTFTGLTGLTELDLSGNLIERVAEFAFYGLDGLYILKLTDNFISLLDTKAFDQSLGNRPLELFLSSNRLDTIKYETFYYLENLMSLYIDANLIQSIEPYAFVSQSNTLITLDLSFNYLSSIQLHHFSYLQALQKLSLIRNQISTIEPGSFYYMFSLAELDLSNNCIFLIDSALFDSLTSLVKLNLNANVLTCLDVKTFSNQASLITLDLSQNYLVELEPLMFANLSSLQSLNLSHNMINHIKEALIFFGLDSLQILDLSNNIIHKLTREGLSALNDQTIKELYLGSNLIKSNKNTMEFNFKYLSVLDLSGNKELFISSSTFISTESNEIDLSFRSMSSIFIQSLGEYLRGEDSIVDRITKLDLSDNNFEASLGQFPFASMNRLTKLYMRNANIRSSLAALNVLNNLIELDLSDNPFAVFEPIFMSYSNKLEVLILSNTGLKNLSEEIDFGYFLRLKHIDLSQNNLKIVDKSIFSLTYFVSFFNFSHNAIEYLVIPKLFTDDPITAGTKNLDLTVDISHNRLESFTVDVIGYEANKIKVSLLMNNNRLYEFDSDLIKESYVILSSLMITLDNNLFTRLPDLVLFKGIYIETLNMNSNNLSNFSDVLFDVFKSLKHLSLSNNQIKAILNQSFYNLYLLETLDLSCNQLADINFNTFNGLNSLIYLNLSFNFIEYFASATFQTMRKLRTLDLNNNVIRIMEDWSFSTLIYTTTLSINLLSRMNFTNSTFSGLNRIELLELSSVQFVDKSNIVNLIDTLQEGRWVQERLYTYYKGIIVRFYRDQKEIDKLYCLLVLYFARHNILLNLSDDTDVNVYLNECQSLDFSTFPARLIEIFKT